LVVPNPEGLDPTLSASPRPACHHRPHRRYEEPRKDLLRAGG